MICFCGTNTKYFAICIKLDSGGQVRFYFSSLKTTPNLFQFPSSAPIISSKGFGRISFNCAPTYGDNRNKSTADNDGSVFSMKFSTINLYILFRSRLIPSVSALRFITVDSACSTWSQVGSLIQTFKYSSESGLDLR